MISYDENKRLINLEKHGIDFKDAPHVFEGFTITREDTRYEYGELRYQTLGLLGGVVVVMVAHTPRGDDDHIISMRKADKHEQKFYWNHYPN
ncbi:hypothetical protein IW01_09495 [Pectobacterium brasiliense]|uniref:BrnT family toxin n=1 Tax=Pectobacterium brasiliense TaxID=180957 RepID=UPI0004E67ACD|nr:BrnT family toxin [Pectobacterium brasiliense]KFF70652.1 hypothetical protein IW01_09495 [Pectobacterium brasiliense]